MSMITHVNGTMELEGDWTEEMVGWLNEIKDNLVESDDGTLSLGREIIDEDKYWESFNVAFENYEKRDDECPECGDYRYDCQCGYEWE